MKIGFFGAGAIGGFLAGHLARAGQCDVSVVARGRTLETLQRDGMRVIVPAGEFIVPVRAVADGRELGPQDYLFITIKGQQLTDALDQIRPLIGPDTAIIPPTTGIPYFFFHGVGGAYRDLRLPLIDPGNRQWDAMPPEQVIGATYWIGVHGMAPGVVAQDGPGVGLPVGELDGRITPRVEALCSVLRASGVHSTPRDNIRGEIWVKFVNSLCWNPVAILTLAHLGQMGELAEIGALVTEAMREVDEIGARLGVRIQHPIAKRVQVTLAAGEHKMSMLQDLEAGRGLELDVLVRSIEALKDLAGMRTPVLDTILSLAKLRELVARRAA